MTPAPPVATGEPDADPEAILKAEEFVNWQDIKKNLADPDLEKVFDMTPDEDESAPPQQQNVEKEAGHQPLPPSAEPEAATTAAHVEL